MDLHHSVSFLEMNCLCIFPGPTEVQALRIALRVEILLAWGCPLVLVLLLHLLDVVLLFIVLSILAPRAPSS